MGESIILEICADSVESALAAQQGGAHRIELCSDLLEGGVTPSAGLISTVRTRVSIGLWVMVRPRGGDFCYSSDEFEVMEQDVLLAKQFGANGVSFGILHEDGTVDVKRTRHLVAIARPLQTTFHRAFDMSQDPVRSLEQLISAGVTRVLTSGGEPNVEDGLPTLAQFVSQAGTRITIVAASGVSEENVQRIIRQGGVHEVHTTAKESLPSPMRYRKERVSMGECKGREYLRVAVVQDKVRRLVDAAADLGPGQNPHCGPNAKRREGHASAENSSRIRRGPKASPTRA